MIASAAAAADDAAPGIINRTKNNELMIIHCVSKKFPPLNSL